MARVAKPGSPNSIIQDPKAGTVLTVTAGDKIEADFNFNNDTPDVATFSLEIQGMPIEWTTGAGAGSESLAAAFGSGSLRLGISPPMTAQPGAYDLQVRILCGQDSIQPTLDLIVQVDPPASGPDEDADPSPVLESKKPARRNPAKQNGATKPAGPEPGADAQHMASPASLQSDSLPIQANDPEPEPGSDHATSSATQSSTAQTAPPPVLPRPRPATPTPTPTPRPRVLPSEPVQEEEVVIVDETTPRPDESGAGQNDHEPKEPFVTDPDDGQAILIRPGETMLVRFRFINDGTRPQTYILDEDRSLPETWIKLVQDQYNAPRNGTGEVSLRLTPPRGAEPGDYPFNVTVGPEGGVLAPRSLVLTVAATPAVKLSPKSAVVSFGPLATAADFTLSVESDGNSDTAYRIGVLAPRAEAEEGQVTSAREYAYETLQWRYLFDKEMDSLKSPGPNRPPRAIPVKLRLQRRGPWWLGWKETHAVVVSAVPVTDPVNGMKKENRAELTAVRWRILPFPTLFLIPILMLLAILLSGSGSGLCVENAALYSINDANVYYVLDPDGKENPDKPNVPMTADLRWDSPWYALLTLHAAAANQDAQSLGVHHDAYSDTRPDQVPKDSYYLERTYSVAPLVFAQPTSITALFVPVRTDNKLEIDSEGNTPLEFHNEDQRLVSGTMASFAASATIHVPRHRTYHLLLQNRSRDLRVEVFVAQVPFSYSIGNVVVGNNVNDMRPGNPLDVPIKYSPKEGTSDDEQLVLVTTDKTHQVIHLHLTTP